jgi:protein O-GlcNAc transferase
VAVAPLEPVYRLNFARAASELGQWDRAINQYREVVRLRPRDSDALTALGATLQKRGDDQGAVLEFTKARRVNPAGPGATLGLATSLEKVGRIDDAIEVFKQYLDIRPTPADADKVKAHLALLSHGALR